MPVRRIPGKSKSKIVSGKFLNDGLLELATDIQRRAIILAPIKDGALRNSGRIKKVLGGYAVIFGSSRVPYARIQEIGGIIKPKKAKMLSWIDSSGDRVFAKSVTIKGKHYLKNGTETVIRGNLAKYWRGKI